MNTLRWMAVLVFGVIMAQATARHRRGLFNLFSDNHQPVYHTGNSSPVVVGDGDGSNTASAQHWMNTLHQQTNRIIEGAGDVVMTPVNMLTHLKSYWPLYVVLFVVVLALALFVYCCCQRTMMEAVLPQSFLLGSFLQTLRHQEVPRLSDGSV